jgi:hypothetical protein
MEAKKNGCGCGSSSAKEKLQFLKHKMNKTNKVYKTKTSFFN